MAQTGKTPISLYYSPTASNTPTSGNLVDGELALNTADGKLFYKDSSGVVQTIASKSATAGTYSSITTNNLTIGTTQLGAGNASAMKNRIINGAMVIDQRNAGASVTPTVDGQYTLDRFAFGLSQASKFSIQQTTTAPTGFVNSLKATVLSAVTVGSSDYFFLLQSIEGYNVADLGWGTANAKTVTLSFQVYSSLTGTFGGAIYNQNNGAPRSYPFTYTISSANTWTSISVTIAGDTSGTWATTNGAGMTVRFGLGAGSSLSGTAGTWAGSNLVSATGATSVVGTNGATFYITGVQLEVGSSATGFEYRQYTTELSLCQRYYFLAGGSIRGYSDTSGTYCSSVPPVTPRATPTITLPVAGTGSGILVVGANGTNGIYALIKTTGGTAFANADGYTMAGSAEL